MLLRELVAFTEKVVRLQNGEYSQRKSCWQTAQDQCAFQIVVADHRYRMLPAGNIFPQSFAGGRRRWSPMCFPEYWLRIAGNAGDNDVVDPGITRDCF